MTIETTPQEIKQMETQLQASQAPNIEALNKLIELLEQTAEHPKPGEFFNLAFWFLDGPDEEDDIGEEQPTDCGTTACAIGRAALHPWFNAQGFRLGSNFSIYEGYSPSRFPAYGYFSHWDAVQAFFGLTEADAHMLFKADSYPDKDQRNPQAVAQRLRQYLASGTTAL